MCIESVLDGSALGEGISKDRYVQAKDGLLRLKTMSVYMQGYELIQIAVVVRVVIRCVVVTGSYLYCSFLGLLLAGGTVSDLPTTL